MAYKLLIADDEEDIRALLTDFFYMQGYQTETAKDGQAAYAVCVVGMFRRIHSAEMEKSIKLLLEAAKRISYDCGYRGVYGTEGDHAAN